MSRLVVFWRSRQQHSSQTAQPISRHSRVTLRYVLLICVLAADALSAQVRVLNLDPDSGLQLRSELTAFTHVLELATEAGPTKVTLSASLFVDPAGVQVQPQLSADGETARQLEIPLSEGNLSAVTFALQVPLAGTYRGELVLDATDTPGGGAGDTKPTRIATTISRSRVAPTVAFDDMKELRVTTRTTPIQTTLILRETAGNPTTVNSIRADIVRIDESTPIETPFEMVFKSSPEEELATPFTLTSGEHKNLILEAPGISSPGHYRTRLTVDSESGVPVVATTDMLLRRPLWVAIVLIGLAVIVSETLRVYLKNRSRLVYQARLSLAQERCAGLRKKLDDEFELDDVEIQTFDRLEEQLQYWDKRVDQFPPTVIDSEISAFIELFEGKLREIVGYWVELRNFKPISDEIRKKLDDVRLFIERPSVKPGGETAAINKQRDELQAIESELKKNSKKNVSAIDMPAILSASTTSGDVQNRLRFLDLATTSVLLVVAVLLGTNLLYLPDPVWGSLSDIFIAILWGFGLHSVGGTLFQGIDGLKARLSRRPG